MYFADLTFPGFVLYYNQKEEREEIKMTETCVCKNCTARETCPFYDVEEESDECVYEVLAEAAKK